MIKSHCEPSGDVDASLLRHDPPGAQNNALTPSRLRQIALLAVVLVGCEANTVDSAGDVSARATLLHNGTIYIETGATFPGAPLFQVEGVEGDLNVDVWLAGDAHFATGGSELSLAVSRDGNVEVPAIVGGAPFSEAILHFAVPGQPELSVSIVTLAPEGVAGAVNYLTDDSGVILLGPDYAIFDVDQLHSGDTGYGISEDRVDDVGVVRSALLGICWCPFAFSTGKLSFAASCRGRLDMWVIPEAGVSPAFTPATADVSYEADGYKSGSQIYKIDGSTCNTISVSGGYYSVYSCVNNLAAMLGKRAPYPVPNGTFVNEPPVGVAAQYVR